MTVRTLLSGFLAAVTVAGCGGSAGTEGSLPDSASSYIMNGGVKTVGSNTTSSGPTYFTGQGLPLTEVCGIENGAEVDGPYLLWVFTATQASSAKITFPSGSYDMQQEPNGNGAFKYISGTKDWVDPNTLINIVYATYVPDTAKKNGDPKNPQLVLSHGCPPKKKGAWCSPGFWKNALDGAWTLIGHSKTELFNVTVHDYFYGATFPENPTLETVLGAPNIYSGPPAAGTSGYALNAFNATGAYLTNYIPGYEFSWDVMQADTLADSDEGCPIDHFGVWKPAPQPIVTSP